MKKVTTLVTFAFIFFVTNAQSSGNIFKPFRVDIDMGFPKQINSKSSIGFAFTLEPRYAIQNEIQIGFRFEAAIMAKLVDQHQSFGYEAAGNANYLLTSDYYFSNKKFRPFVGAGLGVSRIYSIGVEVYNDGQPTADYNFASETKIASLIRTGFEFGHGRLGIEYNLIPKSTITTAQNNTLSITNSYLAFKLGVAIGGGRYKK